MYHRFRLKLFERRRKEFIVGDIPYERGHRVSRHPLPGPKALGKGGDGRKRGDADLMVPEAAKKIVEDGYVVPALREVECRWPAAISVSAQHQNLHRPSLANQARAYSGAAMG